MQLILYLRDDGRDDSHRLPLEGLVRADLVEAVEWVFMITLPMRIVAKKLLIYD